MKYITSTIIALLLALLLVLFFVGSNSQNYTDEQIVNAIYKAEGSEKAKKPFGILSVPCEGYDSCRQICLNTVKNNRKRYADYGHKDYDTYLEFLASRYCPIGADNDPKGLNKNWLKNVRYFLNQ